MSRSKILSSLFFFQERSSSSVRQHPSVFSFQFYVNIIQCNYHTDFTKPSSILPVDWVGTTSSPLFATSIFIYLSQVTFRYKEMKTYLVSKRLNPPLTSTLGPLYGSYFRTLFLCVPLTNPLTFPHNVLFS